jgi:hypothetical protein
MQSIQPPLAQRTHEGIHLLQTLPGKPARISLPFFCLDIRNCNVGTILSELFGYGCAETRRPASDERILTRKYRDQEVWKTSFKYKSCSSISSRKVILNLWNSKERCKWCWPSKLAAVMSQLT